MIKASNFKVVGSVEFFYNLHGLKHGHHIATQKVISFRVKYYQNPLLKPHHNHISSSALFWYVTLSEFYFLIKEMWRKKGRGGGRTRMIEKACLKTCSDISGITWLGGWLLWLKQTAIKAQLSTMDLLYAYMAPVKGYFGHFSKAWCWIIPIFKGHRDLRAKRRVRTT